MNEQTDRLDADLVVRRYGLARRITILDACSPATRTRNCNDRIALAVTNSDSARVREKDRELAAAAKCFSKLNLGPSSVTASLFLFHSSRGFFFVLRMLGRHVLLAGLPVPSVQRSTLE